MGKSEEDFEEDTIRMDMTFSIPPPAQVKKPEPESEEKVSLLSIFKAIASRLSYFCYNNLTYR